MGCDGSGEGVVCKTKNWSSMVHDMCDAGIGEWRLQFFFRPLPPSPVLERLAAT